MENKKPASVDEYIAGFPAEVQMILEQVRATIHKAAPGAYRKDQLCGSPLSPITVATWYILQPLRIISGFIPHP